MKITSYIHPVRTYLPCSGVGRHINQVLTHVDRKSQADVELIVSREWLGSDNRLNLTCPLRRLPTHSFPMPENSTERSWKLFGIPCIDRYIPDDSDWLYAPMETYLPVSKCPVAVTIHDIQAFETGLPWSRGFRHRWFRYKWSRWVRRTLSHSRVIFTVSEFSKQRMVDLLDADADKIVVVGNGVEQAFFDVARESYRHDQPTSVLTPYVFMIGGLRQKKGGDHFLAVAERLRQQHSDIKIVIAGKSDPDYIKAAADYPNIVLLGLVDDEDLPNLLHHSVCLLFLSLYEGFGIPPLEAMAARVPAIVANCASLPEVVGDAGVVVEPDAYDEIVEAITSLEKYDSLRQYYIQKGVEHVKEYTWDHCAERVVSTLEKFL